ncbi:Flagellar hook-length control protein [Paramixta manurensis]|uniref:Flagellar hook-length control protein n=1 Tax=Paramixta manurensis TaxID=2740817 RepID=A0A6M8U4S6_9GAMM|nr:Flagellar hook-length control protein [Erwiniaceae bacterium PD-1]
MLAPSPISVMPNSPEVLAKSPALPAEQPITVGVLPFILADLVPSPGQARPMSDETVSDPRQEKTDEGNDADLLQLLNLLLPQPPEPPNVMPADGAKGAAPGLVASATASATNRVLLDNRLQPMAGMPLPEAVKVANVPLNGRPTAEIPMPQPDKLVRAWEAVSVAPGLETPTLAPVSLSSASATELSAKSAKSVDHTLTQPMPLAFDTTNDVDLQREKLRQVLGERLQLQIDQRTQHATIRLDPPDLGKIDISLHFDANKLQVQIQAGQPDVVRALQQASQELRQALTEQNTLQVQVNISSQQQGTGQQSHESARQPIPVLAAGVAAPTEEEPRDTPSHLDHSILTTV